MSLHQISYQSTARQFLTDDDLQDLLAKARVYNAAHHISGMLLCRGGQFVQVLEGEEAVLRALYEKIKVDPRHSDLRLLVDEPLAQRQFGLWTMAYRV